MPNSRRRIGLGRKWLLACLMVSMPAAAAAALEPGQIVLIVNRNVPVGGQLAEGYSQARKIPAGHTIVLDLPAGDEIAFADYERLVMPPVRQFLREHKLAQSTTCLVTFYGVPLRIGPRSNSAAEKQELADLQEQEKKRLADGDAVAAQLEQFTASLNADFRPLGGQSLKMLLNRTQFAATDASASLAKMDAAARQKGVDQFLDLLDKLGGDAEVVQHLTEPDVAEAIQNSPEAKKWHDLPRRQEETRKEIQSLQDRRYDPDARAKLRAVAGDRLGILGAAQAIDDQIPYFQMDDTISCVDNELSLLWWNSYPRSKWLANPLFYRSGPSNGTPTMMVMRLDGPDPKTVANLIQTSVRVEKEGLKGVIVLNSRAIKPVEDGKANAYGQYDERIRRLAQFLKDHTNLRVDLTDGALLGPHAEKNVAIYCGWYSLRHYVPSCDFTPGAVGFHIASLEMVSLHGKQETGWVHGLLSDGVVGTLGPVGEPYLNSFPAPEEFFPLLMTGKLSLAEVYWKTTPLSSWMIGAIGDPLYCPYKNDPAVKVEDLPEFLKPAMEAKPAATQAVGGFDR